MSSMQKRIRQLLSRVPVVYEGAAILRLVWLRFTYSGRGAISAILLVRLKQGLALDVGANRGQSAIRLARLKPDFNIISFEPNRRCQFALRVVKVMLGKRFRFESAGVSDQNGEVTYYEPFVNSLPVSAEGTFLQENLDEEMEERLGKHYEVKKTIFPVLRLDDLNLSPDFVKIDVQGWELNVLRGARETILKYRPVLVIERNSHNERETTEYLEGLGYRKLDEEALRQNGLAFADISGDNVFVHQSPAPS
jgi:FkbM family methyltransferase